MGGSSPFATLNDIDTLWRPLKETEKTRAASLLKNVSSILRVEAMKRGQDLDKNIADFAPLADVATQVTVDIVARALMTSTDQEPMTQFSESALGYAVSGSFLSPGGGIFVKESELARLGLKRQKVGAIKLWP